MSRREAEERLHQSNTALKVSLETVRSGCRDTLPGLMEQVNRVDSFFIRRTIPSPEFQNMKNSLREYAALQELIRPEEPGFQECREQMETMAKQLLTDAGRYVRLNNGGDRNRNGKKRAAAAVEVLNFARQQLRELTQINNLLEDIAEAGIQLAQEPPASQKKPEGMPWERQQEIVKQLLAEHGKQSGKKPEKQFGKKPDKKPERKQERAPAEKKQGMTGAKSL